MQQPAMESWNGIASTVKVIAGRKQCSAVEAVHLCNVTTAAEAPAGGVSHYEVRDCVRPAQ